MERLKIMRKFNKEILQDETALLNEMLQNTDLSEKDKAKIQQEMRKLKIKNAKEAADYEMALTKDKIENMKDAEEKFQEFMNDNRTKTVMDMWSMALDIANYYYDNEIQRIDELMAKNQEASDEKLRLLEENNSLGLLSEEYYTAQRKTLLAKQAEDEKKLADKKKELQIKQAKWQKANAIIQAMISTAQAVTSALSTPPAPLGMALAIIVGALGAVQIATIASQKIPEYAEGTDFHPGGIAKVGDAGKAELVDEPRRGKWVTPSRPTLVNLDRGAKVYPDAKEWLKEHTFGNVISLPNITQRYEDEKTVNSANEPDEVSRGYLRSMDRKLGRIWGNSKYAIELERQREFYIP
jgi:hypothetical protein